MTKEEKDKIELELETRKIKALEKIANSLDALTVWFEEIDKDEWGSRIQYYLAEFHNKIVKEISFKEEEEEIKTEDKKVKKNAK
jgi:hypothetical protein